MVLACTYQRDLVHAGYLALALLLFRTRAQLQRAGSLPHQQQRLTSATSAPDDTPTAAHHVDLLAAPQMWDVLPGTPFWMLPAFNLLVLLLQAVYQVRPVKRMQVASCST